jgi:hypothetical protein
VGALDKISLGVDSSGRTIWLTRQHAQFYDRVNAEIGGQLVIVQGGWSNAGPSAGTHLLAMCVDFRSWNLSADVRTHAVHFGRDLGGTMWWRTPADGFDEHIHNNLIGDAPANPLALAQVVQYKQGLNGLANHARDRDPYRPNPITDYHYIEDDMTPEEHAELFRIGTRLDSFATNERNRDVAERDRFKAAVDRLGKQVDALGQKINATADPATKEQLKAVKKEIMTILKDHPDVTGVDNPSDDAMKDL